MTHTDFSGPACREVRHLLGVDPEHPCGDLVNGFMLAINRFPLHDDRAQQNAKRPGM